MTDSWYSTIGSYAGSAAGAVSGSAGSAANGVNNWWNSGSTQTENKKPSSENTKGTSSSYASTIGSYAGSASGAVSGTVGYATNGVKSWWGSAENLSSESQKPVPNVSQSSSKTVSSSYASTIGSAVTGSVGYATNGVKSWWGSAENLSSQSQKPVQNGSDSSSKTINSSYTSTIESYAGTAIGSVGYATNGLKSWWGSAENLSSESQKPVQNDSVSSSYAPTIGSYPGARKWSELYENYSSKDQTPTQPIRENDRYYSSTLKTYAENASGAVSDSMSYAANGVKTWWNTPGQPLEEKESSGDSVRGTVLAMGKNASNYVVQTAGRNSNIVNIFDKSKISSLGNPKWWVRFDRPHGNVPFNHININPKLTGVPDPHIPISAGTAKVAGYMGKVAEVANDVAPVVVTALVAYEAYNLGKEVQKDYQDGTTRNTITKAATLGGTYTSAYVGSSAGATIGTSLLPGVGTIFGGLLGGGVAAVYGKQATEAATEKVLDYYEWDTEKTKNKI